MVSTERFSGQMLRHCEGIWYDLHAVFLGGIEYNRPNKPVPLLTYGLGGLSTHMHPVSFVSLRMCVTGSLRFFLAINCLTLFACLTVEICCYIKMPLNGWDQKHSFKNM